MITHIDLFITNLCILLGLEKSGNVPSGSYSGGMKRRLSIGIAMIGDPPVVLLDEPTSGVDPASRRQFWEVISSAKASGQSLILTSHRYYIYIHNSKILLTNYMY